MARINIEDKWWNDPRRTRLIKLLNGNSTLADGSFLQALRASQDHCETGFIPWSEAQYLENIELLIECDLVTIFEANVKQTPSKAKQTIANAKENVATVEQMQAYVAGTQNSNGWLKKRREAARKGGVKSASKRKKIPKSDQKDQANGKQTEANVKQTEPSYSSSSSSSSSNSDSDSFSLNIGGKKNFEYSENFEILWKAYERKGDKAKAFRVFNQLKLNPEGIAALTEAIYKYKQYQPDPQFRKHFERYLQTDWREDLNREPEKSKTQLRNEKNKLTILKFRNSYKEEKANEV